jgi:tetratricopeptide (TPR) repeat protein
VAGDFACRARAAIDRTRRGLAEAEAAGHAYSITAASRVLGLALLRRGDLAQAIPVAERAAELIRSGDFAVLSAWITGMLGSAYVLAGKLDEVLLPAGGGRRADAAMQVNIGDAAVIATLGEACLLSGRRAEATAHAECALKILRERRERDHEASALHLAGKIAAANADSATAISTLRAAASRATTSACDHCGRIATSLSAACTGVPATERRHAASWHGVAPLPRDGNATLARRKLREQAEAAAEGVLETHSYAPAICTSCVSAAYRCASDPDHIDRGMPARIRRAVNANVLQVISQSRSTRLTTSV